MCVLFEFHSSDNKVFRLLTVGPGMTEMALIITMEPGIVLIVCKKNIANDCKGCPLLISVSYVTVIDVMIWVSQFVKNCQECLWILKNKSGSIDSSHTHFHSLLDSPKKKQVNSGYQYLWKQNKYRNTWNNNEQLILRWINLSFDFW